jgi:hypothetical protein
MTSATYQVTGMTCEHCVHAVTSSPGASTGPGGNPGRQSDPGLVREPGPFG